MAKNMMSVSWGDHLEFGEAEGALDTEGAIDSSVERWQKELGASTVLWREARSKKKFARKFSTPNVTPRSISPRYDDSLDEHQVLVESTHKRGMEAFVYVTIFDEGWPREESWRGGFEGWQSFYVLRHPDHQMMSRDGERVHHGVLNYAYPEARQYKIGTIDWLLSGYDWDGVFICTRSQSRPPAYADEFGFNEPTVQEYKRRYGVDVRKEDFDLDSWRRLQGEYLTQLIREVKAHLGDRQLPLAVGIPRASYLGPPVGNLHLDWLTWIKEGLVDRLVIDQVAPICPSTWTYLWPGDQGFGYVQNHLSGKCIAPADEDVRDKWGPAIHHSNTDLYLAQMWKEFDRHEHEKLASIPGVSGLVFSSFHYDNPQVLARNLWAM